MLRDFVTVPEYENPAVQRLSRAVVTQSLDYFEFAKDVA